MNFSIDQLANAASSVASPDAETSDGTLNLPKALVGALVGALAAGLVYGVVGRFVGEFSYLAVVIGSAAGLAAVRLGGKPSPVAGGVAAVASLIMVLAAKVIVGSPAGISWLSYHTTLFDIMFCYIANPVAAFVAGGTGAGRGLLSRLPF